MTEPAEPETSIEEMTEEDLEGMIQLLRHENGQELRKQGAAIAGPNGKAIGEYQAAGRAAPPVEPAKITGLPLFHFAKTLTLAGAVTSPLAVGLLSTDASDLICAFTVVTCARIGA